MRISDHFANLKVAEDGIFVAELPEHVSRQTIEVMLEEVWAHPSWRQPWGLVVVAGDGTTYDPDVRRTGVPGEDKRAAATAVVTSSMMQRTVVQTMGMGLRLASNFHLTGHSDLGEAVETVRKLVQGELDEAKS
jgi:hypothetical protein